MDQNFSMDAAQPLANSLKQAAERIDCSVNYLREKILSGELRSVRFGRAVRILETDLVEFVNSAPVNDENTRRLYRRKVGR